MGLIEVVKLLMTITLLALYVFCWWVLTRLERIQQRKLPKVKISNGLREKINWLVFGAVIVSHSLYVIVTPISLTESIGKIILMIFNLYICFTVLGWFKDICEVPDREPKNEDHDV